MSGDQATFEQFAAGLSPSLASSAFASEALADAYWRARRKGHPHVAIVGAARNVSNAANPVAVLVTRLRQLAESAPPAGRAKASHLDPHQPCPDEHDGCVLCTCDPKAGTVHHVPTPMPDWFKQAWHELRVARTGLMP